jgi:EAL domain-containing protein (putative c-di-GMP-specific phosphodiesterase class I)
VTGFEALIRWNKLDRGLLYPDKFIDLMEMNELIHSLTDFVIEEALEKLRFFHSKGQLFNISVNVSTRNLLDKDFPNRLHLLLKKSGVAAHHLDLEITESAIIKDPVRVLEVLDKIKRIGIMLSIDDYGTGYSSLSYLKQLPIHVLKIDRSFIMNLERNKSDHTIVSSTIALAHNLGLKVVAEGVETESALEILNEQNCDFAQGYFFSKPIPEELLGDYLKQARS